jgi:hypothetical protein
VLLAETGSLILELLAVDGLTAVAVHGSNVTTL